MAFQKPSLNEIKSDIKNAKIYLRAEPKHGKTTLFRDVVLERFKDPRCGLLIKCGAENGDTMLDGINSTQVKTWEELEELIEWLIDEKGKEHRIEMVAFDTTDELFKMAEERTLKESFQQAKDFRKKDDPMPRKPKSMNVAFDGYGHGHDHLIGRVITPLVLKVEDHFGVWFIGHTKDRVNTKGVTSIDNDMGVRQLTSSLDRRYEACIDALADIVVTGAFENDAVIGTTKTGIGKNTKEITLVDATKQRRMLYFRQSQKVNSGGRISDRAIMPEFMELKLNQNNAKEFIRIIELGMETSKLKYRDDIDPVVFKNIYGYEKPDHISVPSLDDDLSSVRKTNEIHSTSKPLESNPVPESAPEFPATDDLPFEEPEPEMTQEELFDKVRKLFNEKSKDASIKAKVASVSGGRLTKNTPIEKLKEILEILK